MGHSVDVCVARLQRITSTPILYSLYGIVVHTGSLHTGHYTAFIKQRTPVDLSKFLQAEFVDRQRLSDKRQFVEFVRRPRPAAVPESTTRNYGNDRAGTWYRISDETVHECRDREEEKQRAYLLFYERIH